MCRPRIVLFVPLRGLGMAAVLLLSVVWAILANCVAAYGQESMTASWYANNPRALNIVINACRDNPAEARENPDCINAAHAQILVMEREGARHIINMHPMNTRQYWQAEPLLRLIEHLKLCKTMTATQRKFNYCDAAERS